jgi:predicted enzyme related to lactoylglutathione lyase
VLGWDADVGPAGPDSVVFKMGEMPIADVQEGDHAPPHWLTYVVAGEANAAREKAKALGANIIMPLIEVPNVGNIVLIQDPVGAFIGLFEPKFPG